MPQAKTGKIVKLYNWNSTNKEWKAWDGTLSTGDISIGAVEIKDQNSDVRANVGSDGLEVEVKKSALPTNASTETRQDDIKGVLDDVVVSLADLVKIGKIEDAVHSSSDVGIMALSVRKDDAASTAGADGDYAALITNEDGILRTQAQQHLHIEKCGATTGWTVLGNDTISLATTTNHIFGTVALEFDKVNGAANTKLAGIQKTITSVSMSAYHKGGGFFLWSTYISDISDVDYVWLRVGTNSTNYNEWRVDEDELSAGWNTLKRGMDAPSTYAGNGWNSAAITYVAVGVAFNAETDALADIAVDHIAANSGLFTTSEILQETTPNINLHKVGNKVTDIGAGDAGTGTQRVSISTNDVNLAAIKTAIEIIDDWDDTNYCNVNLNVAGTDVAANAGNMSAQTLRVVVATNDTHFGTVGAGSDVDGVIHGQLRYIGEADNSIKTAIEKIDDWEGSGNYADYCKSAIYINNGSGSPIIALGDASGHLQVDVLSTASHAVTNAGTFAVQVDGSALTALQLIDDVIYADDADWTDSTSKHALVGGLYQSTPQTVTDGDVAPFQSDSHGNIKSVITDGTDIALVDGSGNLMCSLGTTISGEDVTNDVLQIGGKIAHDAAIANVNPVFIGYEYKDFDGSALPNNVGTEGDAVRAGGSAYGVGYVMLVNEDGSAVGNIGTVSTVTAVTDITNTVTVDLGANNDVTVTSGSIDVLGDTAHDAADSGDPVKIGHKAVLFDSSAPPNAAAAENDRVNSIADEYGRQYVETTHPNYWDVSADYGAAQTNATVKAAAGAGLSLYITDIVISNGAVAGNITLLDGSGGTVLFEIYPAINGGVSTNLRTPIKLTANTLLACTSTTVTTNSIFISGFTAP